MADDDVKPRTIPEALGLLDRKCVAIVETVKESLGERTTIEALLDIKKMFPDENECIFAIYAYSMALGSKKAEEKFNKAIPQIANQGIQAGITGVLSQMDNMLHAMEDAGMIKIIDIDPDKLKHNPSDSSLPDDLLYGCGSSDSGCTPFIQKKETTEKPAEKSAGKSSDEDRMYG